jgi:hypothetical protein
LNQADIKIHKRVKRFLRQKQDENEALKNFIASLLEDRHDLLKNEGPLSKNVAKADHPILKQL